jgi:hydrogenase expression/formation protein HypD
MLRVPGSDSTLEKEKAKGCDVRIVYSTTDAIRIAKENSSSKVIFFGIGFETTSPTVAASLLEAQKGNVSNYFVLCAHKLIPPAMEALISGFKIKIDGFICPGHVSTIIGSRPYEFIPLNYRIPCVIAGFEPVDILETVYKLLCQIREGMPRVEIQYKRVVTEDGNKKAKEIMGKTFQIIDSEWRGLGIIPNSGLTLRGEFSQYNAEIQFGLNVDRRDARTGCMCGDVLRGVKTPPECPLFKEVCTPEHPVGACMVSSEGTCSSYYKYEE